MDLDEADGSRSITSINVTPSYPKEQPYTTHKCTCELYSISHAKEEMQQAFKSLLKQREETPASLGKRKRNEELDLQHEGIVSDLSRISQSTLEKKKLYVYFGFSSGV